MTTYNNVLSVDDINYLLGLPEVLNAKSRIDARDTGSIYFTISIPDTIKSIINERMGLDLSNVDKIPMRWIKGDTVPHIDTGNDDFENTYLIYLVDSLGEFIINDQSYPITKGTAYKFQEGLNHETVNTGFEPRLLLGPMSETGFAVGAAPYIYIRHEWSFIEYSNDQLDWYATSFPMELYAERVEFVSDITITSADQYFTCVNSNIRIGSRSLKEDGSRPVITIDGVVNYPGLINNGSNSSNGYNYVDIFNLEVRAINGSTLSSDGGWIGQAYFGKQAFRNYIVNCLSDGLIIDGGGGILGGYCAVGSGESDSSSMYIIGCTSSGDTGRYSGCIIGFYAGSNGGHLECRSCWSSGIIGDDAGGIVGYSAGSTEGLGGYVIALNCYSTGIISGTNAGGIYGSFAVAPIEVRAENCYSRGMISGTNAGGIFGSDAVIYGGSAVVLNCYSSGALMSGLVNGMFSGGTDGIEADRSATNFYVADDEWSSSTANSNLTGTPVSTVGSIWVANGVNQPYQLYNMGYSPYTIDNIDTGDSSELTRTFDITVEAGSSSDPAIVSGRSYQILSVSDPSITINSTTGVISTTVSTPSDTYTVYIRNTGSYNITTVSLTVVYTEPIPCLLEDTMILTPSGYVNIKELKEHDDVITSNSKTVKISKVFTTIARGNDDTYPCVIPKNAIAPNYPPSNLKISQNHLIKYYNQWICPRDFFPLDKSYKTIKYYHVKLENYLTDDLVINDGVVVESYSTDDLETVPRFTRRLRSHLNKGFYN